MYKRQAVDRLGLDVVAADDAIIAALCHAADGQDEHREDVYKRQAQEKVLRAAPAMPSG